MRYLLDTNACIRYLNTPESSVAERLSALSPDDVAVSSVTKAKVSHFLGCLISLPFDDRAAECCGAVRARLASKGTPIGPYDLLIAAIALANGLTLVTHNMREFERIEELPVEDWESS